MLKWIEYHSCTTVSFTHCLKIYYNRISTTDNFTCFNASIVSFYWVRNLWVEQKFPNVILCTLSIE